MANTTSRQRKGVIDLGGAIAKGFINKRYRDDDRAYQRRVRDEALQREMERMRIQAEANKAIELIRADTSKNEMQKKKEIAEITANAKIEVAQLGRYKKIVNVYDKQGGDGGGYGSGADANEAEAMTMFRNKYLYFRKESGVEEGKQNKYGKADLKRIEKDAINKAHTAVFDELKYNAPVFKQKLERIMNTLNTTPPFDNAIELRDYANMAYTDYNRLGALLPAFNPKIFIEPLVNITATQGLDFEAKSKSKPSTRVPLLPGKKKRWEESGKLTYSKPNAKYDMFEDDKNIDSLKKAEQEIYKELQANYKASYK